ncbi:hypothetical protein DV736_g658, partial [Chaetothyriales sp. CBS 134916]
MASSAQFANTEKFAHHQLALEYGESLIQRRHQQGPCLERIPAWTPFRTYLSEALDYITPGSPSECIADGMVIACVIDRNSGDRTYLDSEVAIFQICTSINRHLSPRAYMDKREEILESWHRTWKTGASLVLVQAPDFNSKTVDTTGHNYVVLDHFRISLIWPEEDGEGEHQYMARLEKCDLRCKSWWTPNQPSPPARREFLGQTGPSLTDLCPGCSKRSPWVYDEAPLCLDHHCSSFWTDISGRSSREVVLTELTFATSFLLYRAYLNSHQHPTFPLARDIVKELNLLTPSALTSSKLLLRGMVCPRCQNIVPKVYWHLWHCDACAPDVQRDYPCKPGVSSLEALVPRDFVSYQGHPHFSSDIPRDIGDNVPRVYKDQFAVDRWTLHGGCQLIVLSPTRLFNESMRGPNSVFTIISNDANSGDLRLHRYRDGEPPALANYFQSTWGAEYGFHGFEASKSVGEAPPSVSAARQLLEHVTLSELGKYSHSNSVQIFGFMQGQGLEWHTDGEGELGETISILNLGGDATFKLRLQQDPYTNINIFQEGHEVVRGAINWERAAAIEAMAAQGKSPSPMEPITHSQGPLNKAEHMASVPLIHGSIVILQGSSFSKYYEHCLDTLGPLTFQVVTRSIDEQKHHDLLMTKHATYLERPNGLLFTANAAENSLNMDRTPSPNPSLVFVHQARPRPAPQTHSRHHRYKQLPHARSPSIDSAVTTKSSGGGNTWTAALESRLVQMHDSGMTYLDIRAADEQLGRWSVTALSTAYKRIVDRRKRSGNYSSAFGSSTFDSRRRRSPQPASLASGSGQPWTQEELDQLWDLRHHVPPLSYAEIEHLQGHRRTEKAYREQMVLEKKKRGIGRLTRLADRKNASRRRVKLAAARERSVQGETDQGQSEGQGQLDTGELAPPPPPPPMSGLQILPDQSDG